MLNSNTGQIATGRPAMPETINASLSMVTACATSTPPGRSRACAKFNISADSPPPMNTTSGCWQFIKQRCRVFGQITFDRIETGNTVAFSIFHRHVKLTVITVYPDGRPPGRRAEKSMDTAPTRCQYPTRLPLETVPALPVRWPVHHVWSACRHSETGHRARPAGPPALSPSQAMPMIWKSGTGSLCCQSGSRSGKKASCAPPRCAITCICAVLWPQSHNGLGKMAGLFPSCAITSNRPCGNSAARRCSSGRPWMLTIRQSCQSASQDAPPQAATRRPPEQPFNHRPQSPHQAGTRAKPHRITRCQNYK